MDAKARPLERIINEPPARNDRERELVTKEIERLLLRIERLKDAKKVRTL